jgi:hypothetical protein
MAAVTRLCTTIGATVTVSYNYDNVTNVVSLFAVVNNSPNPVTFTVDITGFGLWSTTVPAHTTNTYTPPSTITLVNRLNAHGVSVMSFPYTYTCQGAG